MKTPLRIEIDGTAHTLTLHWPDGATQRIAHRLLREHCPCAECKRVRLHGAQPTASEDIAVLEVRAAGYGVHCCSATATSAASSRGPFWRNCPARIDTRACHVTSHLTGAPDSSGFAI